MPFVLIEFSQAGGGDGIDEVIREARAALEAKAARRKRSRPKAKAKGAKPKSKADDEASGDDKEDASSSDEEAASSDPAGAAPRKRPARAAAAIDVQLSERDVKRLLKACSEEEGLEAMFTVREAKKDDNRNRYASKAYGKWPRREEYTEVKKFAYQRAAETWDKAHGKI